MLLCLKGKFLIFFMSIFERIINFCEPNTSKETDSQREKVYRGKEQPKITQVEKIRMLREEQKER